MTYVQLACILCAVFKGTSGDMKKDVTENLETCLDHKGKVVSHGDRFFPLGSDPCTQCTCLNGKPEMCIAVFCSPPENCRQFHALSDKCCEFVCLDRDFPNKGSGNGTYSDSDSLSTTNLGLRLVASTVTSFLILALLLFMVHRLRQRRLLLMIRRFHARRMDTGNSHLSRRFSEDDDGSVGYFVGHDHLDFSRYDEPPPPYTLWKPPEMYIPPGEAPPPYDLSVQLTSPFPNTTRFNFVSSGNSESLQHMAVPILLSESHLTSSQDVSLGTFSTPVSTSATNQNLTVVQPTDRMPSVSNMSIISDPDVENPVVGVSDRVALPPDIQYEESQNYRSINTTGCTQPESSILPDLSEEDLVNGNIVPDVVSSTSQDEVDVASASCTCVVGGRKGKSWSKRHSCSEFTEQSRSRGSVGRNRDKRFSLGPLTNRQNNNFYPDPTAWSGEASESSSSSSPTYDQPTLSPSTSDSSSVDVDFSHDPLEHGSKGIGHRASVSKLCTTPGEALSTTTTKDNELSNDVSKPPHFQKTLSHLKKFSLIKRKKKRREDKANEISCSFVCQNITDGVLTGHSHSYTAGSENVTLMRNGETCAARPMEAINPHIGHKLASSGLKTLARPTNINIPGQRCLPAESQRRGAISAYSAGCSENNGAPLSPAVVAVHYNSSKLNRFSGKQLTNGEGSSNHDLACSDMQSYIARHQSIALNQSPPSLHGHGITRSGSICSETGERRHHKSPLCSSPLSISRARNLDENSEQQSRLDSASGSLYVSSICIPEGSRTAVSALDDSISPKVESSIIRSIPAWIANSMAVLPKQEYETSIAQQGVMPNLSRCLSLGQIEENSFNPIIGVNVPVTLEIRDHTLCDSSWEACSHL